MLRQFAVSSLAAVLGFQNLLAQVTTAAKEDSYRLCRATMRQTPESAYEPCKAWVDTYPSDDTNWKFVKTWVDTYDKMRPYVQFLRSLAAENPKAPWIVYEPDLHLELPQTDEPEGPNRVQISRSFANANEEQMLRKAEAVYSSPGRMVEDAFRNLLFLEQDVKEMAPTWGVRGNDNIQMTNVVTARAVRYYYDLAMAAKLKPDLPTGFRAVHINLKYIATIKHFDQYAHAKDTFTDVYVADLTLQWSFICGGLCGMGFTRNKLVVLDGSGNVITMYLDAPINSQSWVS